jgi:hypothetical protein
MVGVYHNSTTRTQAWMLKHPSVLSRFTAPPRRLLAPVAAPSRDANEPCKATSAPSPTRKSPSSASLMANTKPDAAGPVRRRRQVRTNNHAERCNRKLRYWEKVRYKWRRRRTLVRYVVLSLDRWWKQAFEPKARGSSPRKPERQKLRTRVA